MPPVLQPSALLLTCTMDAEKFMMTLGKPSLGPTRHISLRLRVLCKCHSALAEASSHQQWCGSEPKARSLASASAWQGGSAQPQPWLGPEPRGCHCFVILLLRRDLSLGQCSKHAGPGPDSLYLSQKSMRG